MTRSDRWKKRESRREMRREKNRKEKERKGKIMTMRTKSRERELYEIKDRNTKPNRGKRRMCAQTLLGITPRKPVFSQLCSSSQMSDLYNFLAKM